MITAYGDLPEMWPAKSSEIRQAGRKRALRKMRHRTKRAGGTDRCGKRSRFRCLNHTICASRVGGFLGAMVRSVQDGRAGTQQGRARRGREMAGRKSQYRERAKFGAPFSH